MAQMAVCTLKGGGLSLARVTNRPADCGKMVETSRTEDPAAGPLARRSAGTETAARLLSGCATKSGARVQTKASADTTINGRAL